jgi:hypothetical protein
MLLQIDLGQAANSVGLIAVDLPLFNAHHGPHGR